MCVQERAFQNVHSKMCVPKCAFKNVHPGICVSIN